MLLIQWSKSKHYFLNLFSNGENPFSMYVERYRSIFGYDHYVQFVHFSLVELLYQFVLVRYGFRTLQSHFNQQLDH
jgi:hypothetical protein